MSIEAELDRRAALGELRGFTLWRVDDGWQANVCDRDISTWHVQHGDTPSEATRASLGIAAAPADKGIFG